MQGKLRRKRIVCNTQKDGILTPFYKNTCVSHRNTRMQPSQELRIVSVSPRLLRPTIFISLSSCRLSVLPHFVGICAIVREGATLVNTKKRVSPVSLMGTDSKERSGRQRKLLFLLYVLTIKLGRKERRDSW